MKQSVNKSDKVTSEILVQPFYKDFSLFMRKFLLVLSALLYM